MSGPISTAQRAWGADAPLWVKMLATACSEASQNRIAKQLGVSAALISNVLANKYRGDMVRIEDLVNGVFMNGTIICPALGEIPISDCRGWREKAKKFGNSNSQRVKMYRACNACQTNDKGDQK